MNHHGIVPNLECGDLSPLWSAAARRRSCANKARWVHLLRQVAATKATTAGVPGAAAALGWSSRRTPN